MSWLFFHPTDAREDCLLVQLYRAVRSMFYPNDDPRYDRFHFPEVVVDTFKREVDQSRGSPYDRGSADSYYNRPRYPHRGGYTDSYPRTVQLSPSEVREYNAGYDEFETFGLKKIIFDG
jgi:hypothetical protein